MMSFVILDIGNASNVTVVYVYMADAIPVDSRPWILSQAQSRVKLVSKFGEQPACERKTNC